MLSDTKGYVEHGSARADVPSLAEDAARSLYRYTYTPPNGQTVNATILATGNNNAKFRAAISHGCQFRRIRVHGPVDVSV